MIENPMDVLNLFPIRKNKNQKQAFRDAVQSYAQSLGYSVSIEKGSIGAKNVVIGDPESARYLVTAHYDTPAALPFPNLITPCNFWPFLGYQLFVVVVMAAFIGVITFVARVITADDFWVGWCAYMSIWLMLVLMLCILVVNIFRQEHLLIILIIKKVKKRLIMHIYMVKKLILPLIH